MADSDSDTQAAPAPAPAAKAAKAPYALTIKFAFADYQVGQQITDADEVNEILAGENVANVLKTSV